MPEPYVGEIKMFAGNFAPRGWALCDGQLLSIPSNDALFSLFGTMYGGDGRTTFGLPDLRGRVPVHYGTGPGLTTRRIGQKGGTERVTLTSNQLPQHRHDWNASGGTANSTNPNNLVFAQAASEVYADDMGDAPKLNANSCAKTGGSQSHANLMPALCVNFIVALVGIYPSRS